jgi:hypothetical protein
MNRIISVLFIAVTFIGISSCKKKSSGGGSKKDIIIVDVDRSDTTSLASALPALAASLDFTTAPLGPMQLDTFATKVDEYLGMYGFKSSQITKVNLKSLSIIIENSPGQKFNFIKDSLTSLRVYVDSFSGTTPIEVAYKTSVPRDQTSLNLAVDPVDFKDVFRSQYMKLLVGFRTQENEGVTASTKFRVNYTFTVTADPNL